MSARRATFTITRLALLAAGLALLLLALVCVPFVFFEPFQVSDSLAQAHAILWLGYFSPVMAFPAVGHWLDRVIPLASDDPRIVLIPLFGLMFVLWSLVFFVIALAIRRLRPTG